MESVSAVLENFKHRRFSSANKRVAELTFSGRPFHVKEKQQGAKYAALWDSRCNGGRGGILIFCKDLLVFNRIQSYDPPRIP